MMNANIPSYMIDGGIFTYKNKRPVYIDRKGTHHYDQGQRMHELFQVSTAFQQQIDEQTLRGCEFFYASLGAENEELRKTVNQLRQLASTRLSNITELQHILENTEVDNRVRSRAEAGKKAKESYFQGKADQERKDLEKVKDAFRKKISSFDGQLEEINQRVKVSLERMQERLGGLSAKVQTCYKKFQATSPTVEPVDKKIQVASEVALEKKVQGNRKADTGEHHRKKILHGEFGEGKSLLSSDVVIEEEIQQTGKEGKNCRKREIIVDVVEQYRSNPERLNIDLKSSLNLFCKNCKKGFPKLKNILIFLYSLSPEFDATRALKFQIPKQQAALLKAIRKAFASRGNCKNFRNFLGLIVTNLDSKRNKKEAIFLRKVRNDLYTFEECLEEELFDLAEYKIKQMIKGYKIEIDENGVNTYDLTEIHSAMSALASNFATVSMVEKYLIILLNKDPSLLSHFNDVIMSHIVKECSKKEKWEPAELLDNLLRTGVKMKEISSLFGMELARQWKLKEAHPQLPSSILLNFWLDNYKEGDCFVAFWKSIPHISWEKDSELLKVCVNGVQRLAEEGKSPKTILADELILALIHLCKGWSENVIFLQLRPIGVILMNWWNLVRDQATAEQRIDFVFNIGNAIGHERNNPEQYIMYLNSLWNECFKERFDCEKITSNFLLKLFIQMNTVSVGKDVDIRNTLADFCWNFWSRISLKNYGLFELYISGKAEVLYKFFVKMLMGTKKEENIEEGRQMYCRLVAFANFGNYEKAVFKCMSISLPEKFWFKLESRIQKKLEKIQFGTSSELNLAQFTAMSKVIVAEMLLITIDRKFFEQFEDAMKVFFIEEVTKNQLDPKVQSSLREFFQLFFEPEKKLERYIQSARNGVVNELPCDFWQDVQKESMALLANLSCQHNHYFHYTRWILEVKNIVTKALIKTMKPLDEKKYLTIEQAVKSISSPYEKKFNDDEQIQKLRDDYFLMLFSAVLKGKDVAWKVFTEKHLSIISEKNLLKCIDIALKNEMIQIDELWKVMKFYIKCGQDKTVENLSRLLIKNSIDQNSLSKILTDVG